MIRLFSSTDKVFTSNGDVVLNPTKAIVHKADNGDYYLDLEMGLEYVDFIVEGNIIVAPTPTGDQAFRIGNVTKKKSKISTRCYHVFYDSENYLIVDSYVVNKNCNEALNHLNNATEPVSEFTVSSDISHIDSFRCVRKSLYEAIQTVLDRWGGHLVRDNFNIQIKSSIGQDNGIIVQYKKNLKDITCSENWDNVVTKILPVGRDGIMLNGVNPSADIYITSSTQYDLPYTKTISFNQDLNEQDYPSEQAFKEALVADLRAQATDYLATNCVPQVNYTLKANLEKLTDVGDAVEVIDERLGVHLMTNVIAFDYDCIFGKYTDIQFGNFPQTIAGLANRIASTTENYINGKGYTATSWNQIQESGAKIAEIVIDGRKYNVYAPNSESGSTVSWNQTQNSGDKIADVTIDGISQEVYAPNTQTFNEASSRVNISSVDTYPIIFGKIKKFFADLKNVAFSGAYSDLSGQPTKLSDFTNDENFVSDDPTFTEASTRANIASGESFATILGKIKKFFADLKAVAFSGSYNDLSDKPTIPDISTKVSKSGDTMTGELEIRRATGVDAQFRSTNTTNGYQISFGWGSGGTNRGIWDTQFAKWIFRSTGTDVTVNGSTVPANKTLASTDQIPTDFVSKTNGGTFNNAVTVNASSSTPFRNQTTAQNSNCYLEFSNGDGYLGWFAVSAGKKPCFQSASDNVLRELATTSDLNRLINYYSSRPSSANIQLGDGTVRYFLATSSMSTGKPTSNDAHILHLAWDNSGGWDGQLALPTTDSQHMQWRTQTNGTWGAWKTLIDSSNIGSQSVANSTKFNGLSMKSYATSSQTSIQIKISGAIRTGFLKIIGDGNGSGVDFIIPIHNSSVGTPVGHWVVAPSPVYIAGTGMFAISITVTAWNTLWVITNYDFY